MYLGQKHNCPDPDEGFFDYNDFDIQVCSICDKEMERFSQFSKSNNKGKMSQWGGKMSQ